MFRDECETTRQHRSIVMCVCVSAWNISPVRCYCYIVRFHLIRGLHHLHKNHDKTFAEMSMSVCVRGCMLFIICQMLTAKHWIESSSNSQTVSI